MFEKIGHASDIAIPSDENTYIISILRESLKLAHLLLSGQDMIRMRKQTLESRTTGREVNFFAVMAGVAAVTPLEVLIPMASPGVNLVTFARKKGGSEK